MTHNLPEGDYFITLRSNTGEVRNVAALSNDAFVMVIPDDIHTPLNHKLWHLKPTDLGYIISNVGTHQYAHPRALDENSPVYLNKEESTVFWIRLVSRGLWRIFLPDSGPQHLAWTEADFVQDQKQGFIKLSRYTDSENQRFDFQRFFGPN